MSYNELDLTVLKSIITNKKHGLDFASEHDPKIFSSEVWNFANVVVGYHSHLQRASHPTSGNRKASQR